MRGHEEDAILGHRQDGLKPGRLRLCVHGARRLVEEEDLRILHDGPLQRDRLPLTARQGESALSDVPVPRTYRALVNHEALTIHSISDVVPHRPEQQDRLLGNVADLGRRTLH